MADRVGQQLGNYRLVALLGQGSFAQVYLGQHLRFKQQAAIKVLHARLTDKEAEHFQHEAETIATLAHPAIVRVLDFDVQEGVPFLVMDYAPNGSLRRRHPKGEVVPLPTIVSYVQQVASALQYAHKHKIIHRDVKPENMLLGRREEVLLSDFGLAAVAHSTGSLSVEAAVGTLPYMAPEQIQGHPRAASDQYALGIIVYEWLCGQRPFEGTLSELMTQHLCQPPPPLQDRAPTISPEVEQVVLRALAKDPKKRFASVQDFALALEAARRKDTSGQTLPVLDAEYSADAGHRTTSLRHLPTGTVTLLFTDIEGSTHLLQQLGEGYADVLAACRHLLRAAFHKYHGHEVDMQGDAFFVAFVRATDAILAVVAAQHALASHPWPQGLAVRVRMGLHTGEPELSSEGYVGLDVHRAARIMSAGHGGQVLLSQTTRDLVVQDLPDGVGLRNLGEHRLKDLRGSERLFQLVTADLPTDFPPLKTLDAHPHNLPVQPTALIGRELEVAAVGQLLQREEVRLVTLTGPGGVGKTRMALQVAAELSEHFADGVFFVNLAPTSDPSLVVPTIAQTLGIREVAGQPLLERIKEGLQQRQIMLLLDNFEQVVSAAVHVADLLTSCPKLKVLVTSREVLHVRAEREFAVPPLALPDPTHLPDLATLPHYAAVALFLERAQAAKPDFQLTAANAQALAEICVRLDGLPLAIELAAARIKLLPPQALLARLAQRLAMLTSGARDVPARHQTLRNTIAWSYDLLGAAEQQLFRRLSVFVGGCTLEAVEAVCAALDGAEVGGSVLDGVGSLLDKSLTHQTEQEGEEPRLVMLETIREYGLETLTASGETEVTRRAHADYYLTLAEEIEPQLGGPQQIVWLERLEREHDNLRAVLQWLVGPEEHEEVGQRKERALRLTGALGQFWDVHTHWSEGRHWLEHVLRGSEIAMASVRAKALTAAANLAFKQTDHARAKVLCEESLTLCRESGDTVGIARSLSLLAQINWSDYTLARSLTEQALAFWKEVGDKENIAWSFHWLAIFMTEQGDYVQGRALFEESLAMHQELGNKRGIAISLIRLAWVMFYAQGDLAAISSLLEEALARCKELGDKEHIADSFTVLGWVAFAQGDVVTARSLTEQALALYREMGYQLRIAEALRHLAMEVAAQGDYATARVLCEDSLIRCKELGDDNSDTFAEILEELAAVVAAQGEPAWAARLWGAVEALRETYGIPLPPGFRTYFGYEQAIAAARAQLGKEAFAAAWAEGRTTPMEQVITTVLRKGGKAGKQ